MYKNKGTSLWNFLLNSGLRKFRNDIDLSIVETCHQLSSANGRSERDKLDRLRSKLTIPRRSSDAVVYHSDRQALSTARYRRAGQLATADICCACVG